MRLPGAPAPHIAMEPAFARPNHSETKLPGISGFTAYRGDLSVRFRAKMFIIGHIWSGMGAMLAKVEERSPQANAEQRKLVGAVGFELEPGCGRRSPQAKS